MLQTKCLSDCWTVSETPSPIPLHCWNWGGGAHLTIAVTFWHWQLDNHATFIKWWPGVQTWERMQSMRENVYIYEERLFESVRCSLLLIPHYDGRLFIPSSNVAIQNSFKHFCLQTCSDETAQTCLFEAYRTLNFLFNKKSSKQPVGITNWLDEEEQETGKLYIGV